MGAATRRARPAVTRAGCTPSVPAPSVATTRRTASRRARAGAESRPRERRASPTERRASPSIGHPPPAPLEPGGRRGGRHDGGPEPLEREGGDEAQPVDLRLGLQLDAGRGRLAVELVAERGAARLEQQRVVGEVGEGRPRLVPASGWSVGRDQEAVLVEERLGGRPPGWSPGGSRRRGRARRRGGGGRATWWWRRPRSRAPSGARRVTASSTRGTSQRAEVPMHPRRTVPVTSSRSAATSASSASSSAWIRRARRTTAWPSSVRNPPVRSNEGDAQLPLEAGQVRRDVRLHGVQRRGRRPRCCRLRRRRSGRRAGGGPSLAEMVPIGNNCLTDCLPRRTVVLTRGSTSPPEVPSAR